LYSSAAFLRYNLRTDENSTGIISYHVKSHDIMAWKQIEINETEGCRSTAVMCQLNMELEFGQYVRAECIPPRSPVLPMRQSSLSRRGRCSTGALPQLDVIGDREALIAFSCACYSCTS
jgi:hypothetical protein